MTQEPTTPAPSFVNISVAQEAELIRAQMDIYAKPRGGCVKVLANLRHLWEEVFMVSDQPRILICFTGETARGEYAGNNRTRIFRVDRSWQVVAMRGHGFKNLLAPPDKQTEENFYDTVENLRDGIRVLQTISAEFPVNYKSIRPMPSVAPTQTANVFMDAYVIEFDTANDIGVVNPDETMN